MRLDRTRAVALLAIPPITLAGGGAEQDPFTLSDDQADQYANGAK